MKRKWLAHDMLSFWCIPRKRRRIVTCSSEVKRGGNSASRFDLERFSAMVKKWTTRTSRPMKKDRLAKPSSPGKSSSHELKGNLWTETGQQHENSRVLLTPVRRKPTLETVVNFREGKLIDCYQRILNCDGTVQVDVLGNTASPSGSDRKGDLGKEQYLSKNDDDGSESEYETASEEEKNDHFTSWHEYADNEIKPEAPMERTEVDDGLIEDGGSTKNYANNSAFSKIENELSSRIGKLLLYVKESSEAEVKYRGVFPERKLELLDERTLLLRRLAANAFLELNEEQTKVVCREWNQTEKPHEVLAMLNSIPVTRADLRTLRGVNWLNDEIINFYMQLLVTRSETNPFLPTVYAFSTFFFEKLQRSGYPGVRRWTKDVDIFSYDLLLIPIHLSVHWVLALVDVRESLVKYYDSLGGSSCGRKCLVEIGDYLVAEMKDKKGAVVDKTAWVFEVEDCPRQGNSSDCGVFVLKCADFLCRDAPLTFSQEHMPSFRVRIAYEILQGELF